MAFKTAAAIGFAEAIDSGGPVLLEPIAVLELRVPAASQGDVLGDLSARRGRIVGSDSAGPGVQTIVAEVPSCELTRYAMDLRAMTAGRGRFDTYHSHYAGVPEHLVAGALATNGKR